MKIRLGLAGIIGMLCLMVGVIAGGRADQGGGELAAGELTVAAGDEHSHADGEDHEHAEGEDHEHAEGEDHEHADGEDHEHADGTDPSHEHADGTDPSHTHADGTDPSHAHSDGTDPNHPHDPTVPHDPNVPHDPTDPTHPHPPTPPAITYTTEQLDLLARTQAWIYPRFANTQAAVAAGYRSIGDSSTGFEHYLHSGYLGSSEILNPATVESLVYKVQGNSRVLVSGMYILPLGQSMANVPLSYTTPQTPWHIHTNLCWNSSLQVVGTTSTGAAGCAPPSFYFVTPPMLHVWLQDTPCGWFADLESVGGDCSAHPH